MQAPELYEGPMSFIKKTVVLTEWIISSETVYFLRLYDEAADDPYND